MRAEADELLERRAVRPAHRVRDQARNELDALTSRVRTPLARVRPLRGCEAVRSRLQGGPEGVAAGIAISVPAVPAAESTLHPVPEQGAQVLVDVLVPPAAERGPAA